MLFWRFICSAIWIALFCFKSNERRTPHALNPVAMMSIYFLGGLMYAGSCGFYFLASRFMGTGLAMVIFFAYPMVIALRDWTVSRQNFSFYTLIALIMITLGLFLLHQPDEQGIQFEGVLFGILAAISYGFYVMGSKRYVHFNIDPNRQTLFVSLASALVFLILALLDDRGLQFPQSGHSWFNLFLLGTVATAIPIQLMIKGLKHISSLRASIISVFEPLVTVLLGVGLLHETITGQQLLGIVIVLGSTLLAQFHKEL